MMVSPASQGILPICTGGEEAEETFEAGIGVGIDVFRHLVVHKRIVLVPDEAAGVTHLCDIAHPVAEVWAAPMPYLIVEHDDAARLAQAGHDLRLPFCAFDDGRWAGSEQVRARDHFGGSIFALRDIGQVVVGSEEEHGEAYIGGRLAMGDDIVRGIVLMPGRDALAKWGSEGVIMNNMGCLSDQRLRECDNRLHVEQAQVGPARLEHSVVELNDAVALFIVLNERAVKICLELGYHIWCQHILKKEIAVPVKLLHPLLYLLRDRYLFLQDVLTPDMIPQLKADLEERDSRPGETAPPTPVSAPG